MQVSCIGEFPPHFFLRIFLRHLHSHAIRILAFTNLMSPYLSSDLSCRISWANQVSIIKYNSNCVILSIRATIAQPITTLTSRISWETQLKISLNYVKARLHWILSYLLSLYGATLCQDAAQPRSLITKIFGDGVVLLYVRVKVSELVLGE